MSLLIAWKVTVVWIECDYAVFSRRTTPEIVLSRKNLNSASVTNWIIVDILKYFLLTLCYHWQTLSTSFLLDIAITEDHYLSLHTLHTQFQFDSSLSFKMMF